MQAFKIGDTVTCVDNDDREEHLSIGESYTILKISSCEEFILLEEVNCIDLFSISRFVLTSKQLSLFQQWEKEYA